MEVAGISLPGLYVFVLGTEDFQIMLYQLNGSYIVAPVTKLHRIAAGAGTYVCDFEGMDCFVATLLAMTAGLLNVMQGGAEFYLPVAGCETMFFVKFVVVFF